MKKGIKKSFLYPVFIYLRYWLNRFVIKGSYYACKFYVKRDIKPVDKTGVTFFGYYNISPQNKECDILYLKTHQEIIRGSLIEPASIRLKTVDGKTVKIAESKAWNWQQGCMLQWLPNSENTILYNDYDENTDTYISRVIDVAGTLIKTYKIPVNNVSKCGQYALSLNYDRLAKMRPDYGYFNRRNNELPPDDQDGIWHLNLKNGLCKLIITLDQLKEIKTSASMKGASHKVNHIDINPSGNKFMFLHRWIGPMGRYMRLITANPDGTDMKILNGDAMTSHCCWLDDQRILSYCKVEELGTGYFVFDSHSNKVLEKTNELPVVDGHPSVSPDGEWLVTDTYPDKARMSKLCLYNLKSRKLVSLGRFYQPLRYRKEKRIDLHPKWSKDGQSIFFESGHSGTRRLYKLN